MCHPQRTLLIIKYHSHYLVSTTMVGDVTFVTNNLYRLIFG